MRICHVITRLVLGGAQENTILTCEGLTARGHDVTLVTGPALGPEGQLLDRAAQGGYRVILLPGMRRAVNPVRDIAAGRALRRIFRELRPDVMHSHSSKAGILARHAAAGVGGMKIVHTIHGLPFHRNLSVLTNRLYAYLERGAAGVSDALISVADSMTVQALAAGVGQPEQFTTIYSGMEVAPYLSRPREADVFRASLNLPDDAVLVTQVSRLAALKGHRFLLDALAAAGDRRLHLCLVGGGHLRGRIEAGVRRRALTGRVHLVGLVAPESIPAIVHASDIVAHCSLHEGLPRAVVQAMLAERPVVCFDTDGAAEVVNGQTGLLIPCGDTRGLVAGIESLASDAVLRKQLGRAGRQRCVHDFDHRIMVDKIAALYESLS